MFSIARILGKPSVRNFSKSLGKVDPGIKLLKNALELNEELEDFDHDDLESDFMNVDKSHKEHEREMRHLKEKEKYHIVKQKYFKDKYPNFLTWNDKEQIKYLHSTNPEMWTIDRLSEGFPALPQIIKKIVKSNWSKAPDKIRNHDLSVQKNWEMFKTRQIPDLPQDLVEHLNKFTNRSLNLKPFEIPDSKKVVQVKKTFKNMEFSDIISSYEKLTGKNKEAETEEIQIRSNTTLQRPPDGTDTYLTVDKKEFKSKRPVTLTELQTKIENKANKGLKLQEEDKLVMKTLQEQVNNKNVEESENKIVDITKNRYEPGSGALARKTQRDYTHLVYPERIMIPKELRQRGYTYRLNDCYYDDDGRFLYRVPGMG